MAAISLNRDEPIGLAGDLAYLVGRLGSSRLEPQVGRRGAWDRVPEAARALMERQVTGKVVLDVG